MVLCVLVYMKDWIDGLLVMVQQYLKGSKSDGYDYKDAGEPNNRFDSQEFNIFEEDEEMIGG